MVGSVGTVWDIFWYGFLRKGGLDHWMAFSLSFSTGVALGFVLSRGWVFARKGGAWLPQLFRFFLVMGVIYGLNGWLSRELFMVLPLGSLRGFVARGVAAATIFPLSYYLHRHYSFA